MLEKLAAESWIAKLLYIVAFVAAASAAYLLLLPLHSWVSAAYPALDNPAIGIVVGLVLAAPVYPVEDRFIRSLPNPDITQYPPLPPGRLFQNIRPLSVGIVAGSVILFVASSHA